MTAHPLFLTKLDHQRLSELLEFARRNRLEDRVHLDDLARELKAATVVSPHELPDDVVTLNTRMKLELPHSQRFMSCQIVLPTELNLSAGRISVLSPLGTALIGQRVGEDVDYYVRGLHRTARIAEILYQPEAADRRKAARSPRRLVI